MRSLTTGATRYQLILRAAARQLCQGVDPDNLLDPHGVSLVGTANSRRIGSSTLLLSFVGIGISTESSKRYSTSEGSTVNLVKYEKYAWQNLRWTLARVKELQTDKSSRRGSSSYPHIRLVGMLILVGPMVGPRIRMLQSEFVTYLGTYFHLLSCYNHLYIWRP